MAKFLIFLDRLINLYMYFVIGACVLSWVPNINPNYPMFHYIFKIAGFYLFPPVFGMDFSPALVMVLCALSTMGLGKIYNKYFKKEPKVIIITPEEFMQKIKEQKEDNKNGD